MRFQSVAIALLLVVALPACGERKSSADDDIFVSSATASSAASPSVTNTGSTVSSGVIVPLPDRAYRVGWVGSNVPPNVGAGQIITAVVTVRNDGNAPWPDLKTSQGTPPGAGAVRLGYRWWREDEPVPSPMSGYASARGELEKPLAPGETAKILIPVQAPSRSGKHKLQFDLVHELVSWFEVKGSRPLILSVEVK